MLSSPIYSCAPNVVIQGSLERGFGYKEAFSVISPNTANPCIFQTLDIHSESLMRCHTRYKPARHGLRANSQDAHKPAAAAAIDQLPITPLVVGE